MKTRVFQFWAGVALIVCATVLAYNNMILWPLLLLGCALYMVVFGEPWVETAKPPKAVVPPPRWPGPEKYVLHPGPVVSQTDGQTHHISAHQLARLYGVRPVDCVVVFPNSPRLGDLRLRDLIHLYPRYDGDYRLPEAS